MNNLDDDLFKVNTLDFIQSSTTDFMGLAAIHLFETLRVDPSGLLDDIKNPKEYELALLSEAMTLVKSNTEKFGRFETEGEMLAIAGIAITISKVLQSKQVEHTLEQVLDATISVWIQCKNE